MKPARMGRALLVIDVQNDLVDALPPPRRTELLARIAELVQRARERGTPLVYVRHNEENGPLRLGSPPWEIAAEVAPRSGEPVVEKQFASAFQETNLEEILKARDAGELTICGMQSDFCVNATARAAVERGYPVTLVADAHATYATAEKSEREIIDSIESGLQELGVRTAPASAF